MQIYIIRHGLPDYANDNLLPDGIKQAKLVAKKLKVIDFDKIYVSSQGRAVETSKYILEYQKAKPIIVDWAREDLGAKYFRDNSKEVNQWYFWVDKYASLFNSEQIYKLGNDWFEHDMIKQTKMKDGYLKMAKVVDNLLDQLGYKHDRENHLYFKYKDVAENVAIIAHGGFAYSFISNLLDIPYPMFVSTHSIMDLTGITIIELLGDVCKAKLLEYNNVSHLKKRYPYKKIPNNPTYVKDSLVK